MYTYREILREMNTGKPFTCVALSLDKKRKSGGDVRTIQARVIEPTEVAGRQLTRKEAADRRKRQTRHVRNVMLLVDGHPTEQIRKLHIPLILSFNGEDVNP